MVQQIANKYTTRVDFKRQDTAAYQAAQKYGWLKDVVSHIPKQDRTVWTYEKVKELANTVNSRAQLKYKNQSAYQQARREGWLDKLFPNNKL
jgi:D-mannonate dehydratase